MTAIAKTCILTKNDKRKRQRNNKVRKIALCETILDKYEYFYSIQKITLSQTLWQREILLSVEDIVIKSILSAKETLQTKWQEVTPATSSYSI